jgi:hypothetical protein
MNTRYLPILAAILLTAGLPSVANASLGAFYDDTNPLISGQASFFSSSSQLYGYIDYAVYAPGDFTGSTPFPAGKYAYCYQIFDSSTSSPIGRFTLDLDSGVTAYSPGSFAFSSGDIKPNDKSFDAPIVTYFFNTRTTNIAANHNSYVLFYAGDFGPETGSGTIFGALNGSVSVQIPAPTPEPASIFLLALAAPALLKIRGRNRK